MTDWLLSIWRRSVLIFLIAVAFGCLLLSGFALAQNPASSGPACETIADSKAHLHCYEMRSSRAAAQAMPPSRELSEGWRLVTTPNGQDGRAVVSVMRTADLARSDPDIAGLTLRCMGGNIEALLITLQSYPVRSHPKVTLKTGGVEQVFMADVAPPGSALLLRDAGVSVEKVWLTSPELAVRIEAEGQTISGVITLAGLRSALDRLRIGCS